MTAKGQEFQIDANGASLRKLVEEQLRRAIIKGHFAPGAHLSDRALCDTFKVSRAVVREAVRRLEAEGLVETVPHRGSFVKILSIEEAEHIYDVRGVLEGLAARGFAKNATDMQIDQLEATIHSIRTTDNSAQIVDLKEKFYSILLDGCKNAYVQVMLSQIFNRITQLRATSLSDPERMPHSLAELNRLVAAIRRRDEDAAWTASLEHVRSAGRVAIDVLRRLRDTEASDKPSRVAGSRGR